jgi:Xaa-Pro aminopeptidase
MIKNSNTYKSRLQELRNILSNNSLDGFLLPYGDEYMNEFIHPASKRLKWLTGFSGSAGYAVILKDKAVVMSDGRYTLQLEQEVDKSIYETADITKTSAAEWISSNVKEGNKIGYDPKLVTQKHINDIKNSLREKGLKEITLTSLKTNPVDQIWQEDRGKAAASQVTIYPDHIAGQTSLEKRQEIAKTLSDKNARALLLATQESICWLLNVRGNDIPFMPLALSFLILNKDASVKWFINENRISEEVRKHLGDGVEVTSPDDFEKELAIIGKKNPRVLFDNKRSSLWFIEQLEKSGCEVKIDDDPCIEIKAVKKESELETTKEAHIEDGAALCKLLHWLDKEGLSGNLTESDIGSKADEFREQSKNFLYNSFPNIIGFKENGAVIHYHIPKGEKGRAIDSDGLLLMDTGGQYRYGTTDITRTVLIGNPTEQAVKDYTLVLKGHIALASAKFPEGITGAQVDTLARNPLWEEGLDYAHGTGHGVGVLLSVHEESANISPRSNKQLKAGMILTNEPGLYRENIHGIRLENVVIVRNTNTDKSMLCFETISLAPFDKKLIDTNLLTEKEREWLNNYHEQVFRKISPHLNEEQSDWLKEATSRI